MCALVTGVQTCALPISLLLIVATVGIVWRMHETSEVPALIAFQALAYYSVARMLDHPASGSITLGVALAAAFLTRGWIGALPIMLTVPFIFMPCSVDRKSTRLNSSH